MDVTGFKFMKEPESSVDQNTEFKRFVDCLTAYRRAKNEKFKDVWYNHARALWKRPNESLSESRVVQQGVN